MSHRLTLYNLANDVIQNSRRKGFKHYVEAFGEVMRDATPLVRDEKVLPSVQRIYRIWEERSIYDSELIQDLNELLGEVSSTFREFCRSRGTKINWLFSFSRGE